MFSLHISSNIQKSAPETCYRSKKQQKYKTRKRRKKSGRKMSVDLKRSRKKCALLLTNSNCSIHAQLDMRPNDDFFPLLLTCIGFLGHQQLLDDDDVFIYVSFSLFLFCILRFCFSLTLFFIVIFFSFFCWNQLSFGFFVCYIEYSMKQYHCFWKCDEFLWCARMRGFEEVFQFTFTVMYESDDTKQIKYSEKRHTFWKSSFEIWWWFVILVIINWKWPLNWS